MEILRTQDLQEKLAAFLYNLIFPKREYDKLPDSVKSGYLSDAEKIIGWFSERSQ